MFIYSLLVIILFMLLLAFFFHCVYLQPTCYFSLNALANVFLPLVYLQPSWCYNISYMFLLMFFCHCVYLLYSLLVIFLWLPTLMFFCCYVYLQPTCYFSLIVIFLWMPTLMFFCHCVYLQPTCYFSLNAHANVFLLLCLFTAYLSLSSLCSC